MAKFIELNKGWKIFGIICCVVLGIIAVALIGIAIESACHGVSFAEHFNTIFGITKKVAEDVVTNPDNAEVADTVASLMI